ncbi:cystinosin homolog isoform X1 [Aphidius gifuensis]|nr:cystinosin homolog isoform X1 [Aphidius gifuensis]XP_044017726.1 cystinosin homolog isoform X1 [Aphidius gifuensis]
MTYLLLWIVTFIAFTPIDAAEFKIKPKDIRITINQQATFNLTLDEDIKVPVNVSFDIPHPDLLKIEPKYLIYQKKSQVMIKVFGINPGSLVVSANVTPANQTIFTQAFVRVTIEKSDTLYHISNIVGWIYFLAWSISFYPQIYSNYKRKSVVGLNFDFVSLNIVGFLMYGLFNCGLYWIPEIEEEYFNRNPKGLNPVQLNDIFFSLHAFAATAFTIAQCFIYETGDQRVSTTARIIHGIFTTIILVSVILSIINYLTWLDFLYYCSYVKLAITLIKYVPQAYYNYQRKSTVGWSIGNIFLDFTGGMLSMLQMILNAYNYDDWWSIIGDPTKFGLGFFSVSFDIFFLIQHYALYRDRNEYLDIQGVCQEQRQTEEDNKKTTYP